MFLFLHFLLEKTHLGKNSLFLFVNIIAQSPRCPFECPSARIPATYTKVLIDRLILVCFLAFLQDITLSLKIFFEILLDKSKTDLWKLVFAKTPCFVVLCCPTPICLNWRGLKWLRGPVQLNPLHLEKGNPQLLLLYSIRLLRHLDRVPVRGNVLPAHMLQVKDLLGITPLPILR